MKNSKETIILSCSNRMFIQNGYSDTTMRKIASESGVSLGLATYYFKTKRRIAVIVMETYLRYLREKLYLHLPRETDPMLYTAAYMRLYIEFFLTHPCKHFYLECLQRDIHVECMEELGAESPYCTDDLPAASLSSDELLLYGSYIPYGAEKALILKKENGGLSSITLDEVPALVFSAAMEKRTDSAHIQSASSGGGVLAKKVLREISPDITSTIFNY